MGGGEYGYDHERPLHIITPAEIESRRQDRIEQCKQLLSESGKKLAVDAIIDDIINNVTTTLPAFIDTTLKKNINERLTIFINDDLKSTLKKHISIQ